MNITGILEKDTTLACLEIEGRKRLQGELVISGSKNAALPIIAACLLVNGEIELTNVPRLDDIETLSGVLRGLGASVTRHDDSLTIDCTDINSFTPRAKFVSRMRASVLVMGPLLSRFGVANIPLPGGCKLGPRPIDIHIDGLSKLGGEFSYTGDLVCVESGRLTGADIPLRFPSVGATENIMIAAVLAEGETVIIGAAKEPEIVSLAEFINRCGGRVSGAGTDIIAIEGVDHLNPVSFKIIPDRIECSTYLIATACTGGDIICRSVETGHITALIEKLTEAGCSISYDEDSIRLRAPGRTEAVDFRTQPYPGFSTDVQPQMMALNAGARGAAIILEKIFTERFLAKKGLVEMGAKIRQVENAALTIGQAKLHGADVTATDIRASAALICAALRAEGRTRIHDLSHLFRGYEDPIGKLEALGVNVSIATE